MEVPRPAVDDPAEKIVARLQKTTEGRSKSGWILNMEGPFRRHSFREIEAAALDAILRDDGSHFNRTFSPCASLQRIPNPDFGIQVMSGLRLGSLTPGTDRPTTDVQAQIDYAIARCLRAKTADVGELEGYTRKCLLIESEYLFAEGKNVSHGINTLRALVGRTDLIFLIDSYHKTELVWGDLFR